MYKLKRLVSFLLTTVFTVILLLPQGQTARASSAKPTPAKINASYKLNDGVQILPEAVSHSYNKSTKSLPLPAVKKGRT